MRLQPTSRRARNKSRWQTSSLSGRARLSRLKRRVKRTQKSAPPHDAAAPDIANGRSQVNRVVPGDRSARNDAVGADSRGRSPLNRIVRLC